MRATICFCLIGLSALCPACNMAYYATHNVCHEVKRGTIEYMECFHDRQEAKAAWKEVQACAPAQASSEDYAAGFKCGFVDFLQRGGSGRPPSLPPKHYWSARYETVEGRRATEDWFAGFQHGASVAGNGRRELRIVPTGPTKSMPSCCIPEARPVDGSLPDRPGGASKEPAAAGARVDSRKLGSKP